MKRIIKEVKKISTEKSEGVAIIVSGDEELAYYLTLEHQASYKQRLYSLLRIKNFLKEFKFRQPYPIDTDSLSIRLKRIIGKEVELVIHSYEDTDFISKISLVEHK